MIGTPDEKWGEAVTAIVVLREGHELTDDVVHEIQDMVKERKGSVQAPKQIIATEALPLTGLGKPDKKALRAQYWTGERERWLEPVRRPSRRDQLATLVPELLLIGQLIDRSGMAWCISAFGREEMAQIAIEEWASSSPLYTRRMQQALGYAPVVPGQGDVVTIFKGLQLDIGAPPQFMDFRYTVHDPWHGEFHLDHCGALMDVEPMGPDYVRSMCHDIEDPTFDATAVASNPRAQVRPIHRPPRLLARPAPALRLDGDHRRVLPRGAADPGARRGRRRRAPPRWSSTRSTRRTTGRPTTPGRWSPTSTSSAFSHSALVRIADEVCLQMHLLNLGFLLAVRARAESRGAGRPRSPPSSWSASPASPPSGSTRRSAPTPSRPSRLHPLLNPAAYVDASVADVVGHGHAAARPTRTAAGSRSAVPTRCARSRPRSTPSTRTSTSRSPAPRPTGPRPSYAATSPAPDADEVAVTRFSTGVTFAFEPRRSLPITPV